jgi:PAS domain S-box-containing protein
MTDTKVLDPTSFRTAALPPEQSLSLFSPEDLLKRFQAIQRVTEAALAHLKLDSLLGVLLERLREMLEVDAVRVLLCTPEGRKLTVRAAVGLEEENGNPVPVPIGQGIAGWVAYHRRAIIVDDMSRVTVVNPLLRRLHSAMVAPLLVEGNLIGVLKVGTLTPRAFGEADLGLLQLVADRVALAIDRARQHEKALQAEQRWREQEEQYRSLFENNPASVFALDLTGSFASVNPATGRISGYAADELIGESFLPLVVEEDRERAAEIFLATLQGTSQSLDVAITHKDGHRVDLRVTALPITAGGQVTGAYGIAEDISERRRYALEQKNLQDRLRAEGLRLEAVLRQMPAGVLIAEAPSGRMLLGNTQVQEILRHPVIPSGSIEEYGGWSALHPDGSPLQPHELPLARVVRAGESVSGEELHYRRGDGTRTWLRVNAAPIRDEEGQIVAGVVVFHDIGRERRATEDMRFLVDVSSTLHSSLDYRSTLRQVVRLAVTRFADWCVLDLVDDQGRMERQEVAHADPAREGLVKEVQRRYPVRYDDEHSPINRALRTGEPILIPYVPPELLQRLARDEEHLEILRSLGLHSAMVVPLPGRDRILGVLSFATAESQRRYTEDDLALAHEVARRSAVAIENAELFEAASSANRAKTEFLAVMSHELRTPLAAILGYAELLQMGIPVVVPEAALRQVERIESAARHQLQLIEEILTFSRLGAGREIVTSAPVDLISPVNEAVAFIRPAAEKKGLALRVTLPEAPCETATDAGKVRQILVNLLFNAVQFTAEGEIEISLECAPDAGRIRVRDTGIGIAPEHQSKVFDAFWQVRQSSTREVGGTGLGLTVAQRVAQLLSGDITVESALGQGSTFTLHLPREEPEQL